MNMFYYSSWNGDSIGNLFSPLLSAYPIPWCSTTSSSSSCYHRHHHVNMYVGWQIERKKVGDIFFMGRLFFY